MKRIFIVTGAEATGTKLVTECLLAAGCHGDATGAQWVERALERGHHFECEPVVLRLPYPRGLEWPSLESLLWQVKSLGYDPTVLVTVRDWFACGQSQQHNRAAAFNVEHSQNKREKAYRAIFGALAFCGTRYCIVTYESLVARPHSAVSEVLAWCGLSASHPLPEVVDANEKWYNPEEPQEAKPFAPLL